jgi:hypothetical protein
MWKLLAPSARPVEDTTASLLLHTPGLSPTLLPLFEKSLYSNEWRQDRHSNASRCATLHGTRNRFEKLIPTLLRPIVIWDTVSGLPWLPAWHSSWPFARPPQGCGNSTLLPLNAICVCRRNQQGCFRAHEHQLLYRVEFCTLPFCSYSSTCPMKKLPSTSVLHALSLTIWRLWRRLLPLPFDRS